VFVKVQEGNELDTKEQKIYRSGVGNFLHMMRWSRLDVFNAVMELSKSMMVASQVHMKAMQRTMQLSWTLPITG
jgi:hypothetical protein